MNNETIRQQNARTSSIETAKSLNNYLDSCFIHSLIVSLENAAAGQEAYEAIMELAQGLKIERCPTLLPAFMATPSQIADRIMLHAADYASHMSMLEHSKNGNGEAIERMTKAAESGEVVRII
jgi:hypothetical protein